MNEQTALSAIHDYVDRVHASRDMHHLFVDLVRGEQGTGVLARLYNRESDPAHLRNLIDELYGHKATITESIWKDVVHEAQILRLQKALDDQGDALREDDVPAAIEATERLKNESPKVLHPSWNGVLSMLTWVLNGDPLDENSFTLLTEGLYSQAWDLLTKAAVEGHMSDYPAEPTPRFMGARHLTFDHLWTDGDSSSLYGFLLSLGIPPLPCTALTMTSRHSASFAEQFFGYLHAVLPPEQATELKEVTSLIDPDNPLFHHNIIENSLDLQRDRALVAVLSHVHQRESADARRELLHLKNLTDGEYARGWQMTIDILDAVGMDEIRANETPAAKRFYVLYDRLMEHQRAHPAVAGELVLDDE